MQVETYEEQEIASAQSEEDICAAKQLVDQLGLSGQEAFYGNQEEARSPFPYRKVTMQERFVYKQLFPSETALEKFSSGAVPLRVLQVAAYAKAQWNGACELFVWHSADVRKDPILFLRAKHPTQSWTHDYYLLARWGDALENFNVLAERAKEQWKASAKAQLMEVRAKADQLLLSLESQAEKCFLDGEVKTYNFYV